MKRSIDSSAAGEADIDVGGVLRRLRRDAGMTLEALARAASCSKAHLSLVESGRRRLSPDLAARLERAVSSNLASGRRERSGERAAGHAGGLVAATHWQRVPLAIRAAVEQQVRGVNRSPPPQASQSTAPPRASQRGAIPIINRVAAGAPAEFTDLDYPRAIADEYLALPDVSDPDAFAARITGDSMQPEYCEGDVVVFSPAAAVDARGGVDCFVRLERDGESTFKRVYFEDGGRVLRLQPLNSAHPPRSVLREDVAGLCPAVYVLRRVRSRV